jgi:hypothetical protein
MTVVYDNINSSDNSDCLNKNMAHKLIDNHLFLIYQYMVHLYIW